MLAEERKEKKRKDPCRIPLSQRIRDWYWKWFFWICACIFRISLPMQESENDSSYFRIRKSKVMKQTYDQPSHPLPEVLIAWPWRKLHLVKVQICHYQSLATESEHMANSEHRRLVLRVRNDLIINWAAKSAGVQCWSIVGESIHFATWTYA